ncbi:hypothetical protein AC1031_010942 [Aphanomyces cochlioides]|nr:hypothetical protein AC1031_010942 [Aphanomyces cochlioides]
MKIAVPIAFLASTSVQLASAQGTPVGAYGQCGGSNYAGSTTCIQGYECHAYSEWYAQCIPSSAATSSPPTSPTTTKATTAPTTATPTSVPTTTKATTAPTTQPISAPTNQPTSAPTKATPSPTTAAPTTAAPTTVAPTTVAPTTAKPVTTTPTPAPTTANPVPPPSSPSTGALKFESKVDGIYLNGAPFYIKGASYFGMETNSYAPHGLWGGPSSTTVQKVSTLLKTNNFNAVRLPLAVDSVLNNPSAVASQIASEVDLVNAFSGKTLRFLDVLDHVIKVLGDNKLLVLLDAHVLSIGSGITDLWYSSSADQNNFENAWSLLANRYKNTWNVIAADLKNEPHGTATWGSGNNATDWDQAAIKWATTIQKIAPHWLIFVEGISKSSRDQKDYPAFWGENLMDVQRAPITLPVANRLVYSAHTYSSDVASQPYFSASNYPDNMPAIWDLHFGFVHGQYGPVVIGEYGGRYSSTSDIQWQNKFVAYLKAKSIGSLYWCVNPNSGDTEGLLLYDWNTPRTDKFNLLSPLPSTPVP